MEVPTYRHDLGEGLFLDAFSIDPSINRDNLESKVREKDGQGNFDLDTLSKHMSYVDKVSSFDEIQFTPLRENYQIPKALEPFRQTLGTKLDSMKRADGGKMFKNGTIAVIDGPLGRNIRFRRGGYYDFQATQYIDPLTKQEAIPGDLLPDTYPLRKTLRKVMQENGISNEKRARYLCFTFITLTNKGKELNLIQRAEGLGINPDCMALTGSTPRFDQDFFKPSFDFSKFYMDEIFNEMNDEYGLKPNEINVESIYLIEDTETIPSMTVTIRTPVPTKEIAKRIYGSEEAVNEHPILYTISSKGEGIRRILNRFPIHKPCMYKMDIMEKDK